MHLAVYLTLLGPILAPALFSAPVGRFLADHLPPGFASRLLAGSAVALATCSTAALGVLVLAGLASWAPLTGGRWSPEAVLALDPPARVAGVAAGLLMVVVLARLGAAGGRLAAEYRAAADAVPDGAVPGRPLLVPGAATVARALPVRGGHVLVGAEVWADLPPRRREVVLAHEQAHLRRRHHLYVCAASVAAAANPLLTSLGRSVDYALERWADEDAADAVGHRGAVAHTIGAVALRAVPARTAGALTMTGGVLPRRVAALLRPRPATRGSRHGVLVAVVLAGLVAGTAGVAAHATTDLGELLGHAGAGHSAHAR